MFKIETLMVLIPALPLTAAIVTALFGKWLLKERSHVPVVAALALSCLLILSRLVPVVRQAAAPARVEPAVIGEWLRLVDGIIARLQIPTQACVLAHVTTTLALIGQGFPVDLVFQSIAGTEAANRSFGIDLNLLGEARAAALSPRRGTLGDSVMYFATGQGSDFSANPHHGHDPQPCEAPP